MIPGLLDELSTVKNKHELERLKLRYSREHHSKKIPKNIDLSCALNHEQLQQFKTLLSSKPVRTISGLAPVAIMAKPFSCPSQAKCTFCPGGPGSVYGDTPKSYPGGSPAHLRGMRNFYDSYLEVFNRLEHYVLMHHDFSKVELIIMGGTFPSYPKQYRDEFVLFALKAMNDFSERFFIDGTLDIEKFMTFFELPADISDAKRTERVQQKLLALKGGSTLEREQERNETSNVRCVVFCIETRADCSLPVHIDDLLRLGGTRVEIGVQTTYDAVLEKIERGNTNQDNITATQLLKDSFLKVCYHMMLGLPGSTPEMDIAMFKEIFSNPDYQPDALKIYPCMVFKGTTLYEQWKAGDYTPITAHDAVRTLLKIKPLIPRYCRVMRIQRDIPTTLVEAGVERTNLRQMLHEEMKKQHVRCQCIRCREPGTNSIDWNRTNLLRFDYEASHGHEVFLSYEDLKNDILLGFLRLRIPHKPYRPEITSRSAGIREIHVYGPAVKVGDRSLYDVQHRGVGTVLMDEAEKIAAEEYDLKKMTVISGIGVREWFKQKFGYARDGPYMSKTL